MLSDIKIAQKAKIKHIKNIASKIGIKENDLEYYGKYKAKLSENIFQKTKNNKNGDLVLISAINPTPLGEGKTTTMIGLGQALWKIGKKAIITIREPSLGPVFGIKGGAAGGGYSQVLPMEDINLHFTGDLHAITSANNLLSALIDNHIKQGNKLKIDLKEITWKRCLDLNDRSLRKIKIGLGGKINGEERIDGFNISVASEIMAIFSLAKNLPDLKKRLGNIIIAKSLDNKIIKAKDLKAEGAMTALLKDAFKPNLIQTLENTPALMHGGPFANIAHGCNSIRATQLALKLGDIVLSEAGFGADLGAEKFMNIKSPLAKLKPKAVVLVATTRALKYNGGIKKENSHKANLKALKKGIVNLEKHIENMQKFKVPIIVSLNYFSQEDKKEIDFIKNICKKHKVEFAVSQVWEKGGKGGVDLALKLVQILKENKSKFKPLYSPNDSISNKIKIIAREIYGAKGVNFSSLAKKQIREIEKIKEDKLPICMAKTQYSLSDDPKKLGRPENFKITIKELRLSAGAGFIIALAGNIMTMPGLPKNPASENIDVNSEGKIIGLF